MIYHNILGELVLKEKKKNWEFRWKRCSDFTSFIWIVLSVESLAMTSSSYVMARNYEGFLRFIMENYDKNLLSIYKSISETWKNLFAILSWLELRKFLDQNCRNWLVDVFSVFFVPLTDRHVVISFIIVQRSLRERLTDST